MERDVLEATAELAARGSLQEYGAEARLAAAANRRAHHPDWNWSGVERGLAHLTAKQKERVRKRIDAAVQKHGRPVAMKVLPREDRFEVAVKHVRRGTNQSTVTRVDKRGRATVTDSFSTVGYHHPGTGELVKKEDLEREGLRLVQGGRRVIR